MKTIIKIISISLSLLPLIVYADVSTPTDNIKAAGLFFLILWLPPVVIALTVTVIVKLVKKNKNQKEVQK